MIDGRGDIDLVRDAMRSGEWLRMQWIARSAFGLGDAHWEPAVGMRAMAALRQLQRTGEVERREDAEQRVGAIGEVEVSFPIPRSEWRLRSQDR